MKQPAAASTIEAILITFGHTANEVADNLEKLHIRGKRDDDTECPIACYLKTRVEADKISVDHNHTTFAVGERTGRVEHPTAIRRFIELFDEGDYPHLDIDPPSVDNWCDDDPFDPSWQVP